MAAEQAAAVPVLKNQQQNVRQPMTVLIMPVQAMSKQPDYKSIQELSYEIKINNEFVTLGSEIITMLSEDKQAISATINIHLRHLLYEDESESGSKYNYDDILIKKNGSIIYTYNYGNYPSYRIINVERDHNVLVLLGGYSHDGHIEIFDIENEVMTKTNHFQCEDENFSDIDNDGIDEIIIADYHGFLIPKGALADSVGIWVVLKYNNGFKFSPDLTKEKYIDSWNILEKRCYYDQQESVKDCGKVIENIVLNFYLGNFNSMARVINSNMVFRNTNEKTEFIRELVDWCFGTQFISEIMACSGLQSQNELLEILTKTHSKE